MALTSGKSDSDGRRRSLFKLPFRNSSDHQATSSSSSSSSHLSDNYIHQSRHFRYQGPRPVVERLGQTHRQQPAATIPSMSSVARSILPTKRRLKLDPSSKLYFPCESYSIQIPILLIITFWGLLESCDFLDHSGDNDSTEDWKKSLAFSFWECWYWILNMMKMMLTCNLNNMMMMMSPCNLIDDDDVNL